MPLPHAVPSAWHALLPDVFLACPSFQQVSAQISPFLIPLSKAALLDSILLALFLLPALDILYM